MDEDINKDLKYYYDFKSGGPGLISLQYIYHKHKYLSTEVTYLEKVWICFQGNLIFLADI